MFLYIFLSKHSSNGIIFFVAGKPTESAPAKSEEDDLIDIGRVDLRVGKIVGGTDY